MTLKSSATFHIGKKYYLWFLAGAVHPTFDTTNLDFHWNSGFPSNIINYAPEQITLIAHAFPLMCLPPGWNKDVHPVFNFHPNSLHILCYFCQPRRNPTTRLMQPSPALLAFQIPHRLQHPDPLFHSHQSLPFLQHLIFHLFPSHTTEK